MSAGGREGPVPAGEGGAGAGGIVSGARAQPFYCPYCGEQEFRPVEEPAGALHCPCCERRYQVRFLGLGPGSGAPAVEASAGGRSGGAAGT